MAVKWWQWKRADRALASWIRPIIGGRPYALRFGPGEGSYCHFGRREVVIDPCMIDHHGGDLLVPRRWRGRLLSTLRELEWRTARTLARHEASHVLFSDPVPIDSPLHGEVYNCLEDGRIERLLGLLYPSTWPDFVMLGRIMWERSDWPLSADEQLLASVLLHRWDILRPRGAPSHLLFAEAVQVRWDEEIRPLVEEAWRAPSSLRVAEIGRELLQRLGDALGTDRLTGLIASAARSVRGAGTIDRQPEGARSDDDRPVSDDALRDMVDTKRCVETDVDSDGPADADDAPESDIDPSGGTALMVPYQALEAEIQPLIQRQLSVLLPPTPDTEPRPSDIPGCFDVRSYVSSRGAMPFVVPRDDAPSADGLAIVLLVDRTGSMGGYPSTAEPDEDDLSFHDPGDRMFHARRAALLLDRACAVGGIPLAIGLAGGRPTNPVTWLRTWDSAQDAEGPKALIAGMYGAGEYERVSASLRLAQVKFARRNGHRQLIVYIHDGAPTDETPEAVKATVAQLRRNGILVVGLYIGPQARFEKIVAIFGDEHAVGVEDVTQLPHRLWVVLKRYFRR